MATRKQKHQAAVAKREIYMQALKDSNSKALRQDRAHRFQKSLSEWQDKHDKSHTPKKTEKECPHCKVITAATR